MNHNIVILRMRKGVPGVGRKMSKHFDANEVTCKHQPAIKVRDNAVVVNYGRSEMPVWFEEARQRGVRMLNNPTAVANSVDKRRTLALLKANGVPCLDFETDPQKVFSQLSTDYGIEWIARTTATGKKGNGIVPVFGGQEYGPEGEPFPNAPLYTRFYNKDVEFRVHVFRGQVIDYVQKKRMGKKKRDAIGLAESNELIRNHKRGWVFAHNDIIHSKLVEQIAVQAANVLGLDYAGIDILAKLGPNGEVRDAVVCESNSAPGMSSSKTFNAYVNAIDTFVKETQQ